MPSPARRSPAPEQRQRDAERTRQALLDAARAEFAAKGLAGARVGAIAERAGVNKQLISYYFGGKDGLYQAILDRWHADEEDLTDPAIGLDELAWRYLEVAHRQPDLQRLFLRETIDQDIAEVGHEPDAPELVDLRRRQDAGEIAADVDPAFLLMVMQAAVISATVFPGDVKRYLGLDPASPEYLAHAGAQLRLLVRRMIAPPPTA
ncbi:MAG: TetR family transcriptional regulator [Geodermatophilaceae bacterium]|nr:TetR family transcriptional regulator [Geodermatophilaceae bacterium]